MVVENKVLWRTFGLKINEVTEMHNEVLHNLFSLPSIRMIKSMRMRCMGHAACTGQKKIAYRDLFANPEETCNLDLVI
jgi:hypothetical protein